MPEFQQRIDHRTEHHDGDADANPEHQHVQVVDLMRQIRHTVRQVVAVRGVGGGALGDRQGGERRRGGQRGHRPPQPQHFLKPDRIHRK